jgi:WD40 repeat protein/serine/threonine protein kinase
VTNQATCGQCGAELPPEGGVCSRCALRMGLEAAAVVAHGEAALDDLPMDPEELIIADTYRVLDVLGRGAMGVVYRARQRNLDRLVAVKMLTAGLFAEPAVRQRFATEARAAASLNHPNIVTLHDWGEHGGCPYFSMELLPGGSLADLVRPGPIAPLRAAEIIAIAARAIHYAHQRNIVHRDLKPANILLDAEGLPKVADFGLAKALDQNEALTLSGQILGTPGYMAPEQAAGASDQAGGAGDIYGLGAVLYHLLTGRPPFQGASVWETLQQVNDSEPAPPRSVNPAVPEDLEVIVLKSLQKRPADRYTTAAELADDLGRWQRGEPIHARRASSLQRLDKWSRRNPALAGSLLLLAASLLVGSVVSLWFGFAAAQSSREASAARAKAESARRREERARQNTEGLWYAANMGLAQQAWDLGDYARLTNILAETAASSDRGFEWYYWHRLAHASLHTLTGHEQPVASVAFSPDGGRIVTGGLDGTVRIWSTATGTNQTILRASDRPIRCVAASSTNDWIAAAGDDGVAQVWEMDGARLRTRVLVPGETVTTMAFSPGADLLYTAGSDQVATAWALPSGERACRFEGHSSRIVSLAVSADGRRLATASWDGTVRVWDAGTGTVIVRYADLRSSPASLIFSPDGTRVLAGLENGSVRICNLSNRTESVTIAPHREPVTCLTAVPKQSCYVSASWDGTAKAWDPEGGPLGYKLVGHSSGLYAIAASPDGTRLATAGMDGTCKVWAASGRNESLSLVPSSPPGWVNAVCMLPDGRQVITGTQDGVVRLWNVAGAEVARILWGPRMGPEHREISALGLSRDGTRLVIGHGNVAGIVIDIATGLVLHEFTGALGGFGALSLSPNGNRFATGGRDRTATVWDLAKRERALVLRGHQDTVTEAVFSPDGLHIATCSTDGSARLWNAVDGSEVGRLEPQERQHLLSVAFSPDGRFLAAGGSGRTVTVWDIPSGKVHRQFRGHAREVMQVLFSPDSTSLLTCAGDSTARLWNLAIGREVMLFKGHVSGVKSVAFSADGRRIVTGSWDGTAKVWEAASTEQAASWPQPVGAR